MSRPLCAGRDPDWWAPESDNARLAMAICRRCVGCPDNDPRPAGIIRQGVPYGDDGAALAVCGCGYPMGQPGWRAKPGSVCSRCALPGLDRWRADVIRWKARGDTFTAMGRRLGFDRVSIRDALARWATEDLNHQQQKEAAA